MGTLPLSEAVNRFFAQKKREQEETAKNFELFLEMCVLKKALKKAHAECKEQFDRMVLITEEVWNTPTHSVVGVRSGDEQEKESRYGFAIQAASTKDSQGNFVWN